MRIPWSSYFAGMVRSSERSKAGRWWWAWGLGALVIVALSAAIWMRASESHRVLLPVGLAAFVAGALIEHRRIAQRWSTVLWTALGAYIISFVVFLPGKHERAYDVEAHIALWPWAFCGFFALFAAAYHWKQVTLQLDEGLGLLQGLAFAYWTLEVGRLTGPGPLRMVLFGVVGAFTLYVVLNAFLPLRLSRTNRLWLSLWSSFILLALALDNVLRVMWMGSVEEQLGPEQVGLVLVNYFLLGFSSIYMVQNALMLFQFLPERGEGWSNYRRRTQEAKDEHVERYAEVQLPPMAALLCMGFTVLFLGPNYVYGWVHRSFAIWSLFVVFPWYWWCVRMLVARQPPP